MKLRLTLLLSSIFIAHAFAEECTTERNAYLAFTSQPLSTNVRLQQTAELVAGTKYPDSVAFQWLFSGFSKALQLREQMMTHLQ